MLIYLRVAICSRLVESRDLSLMICSWLSSGPPGVPGACLSSVAFSLATSATSRFLEVSKCLSKASFKYLIWSLMVSTWIKSDKLDNKKVVRVDKSWVFYLVLDSCWVDCVYVVEVTSLEWLKFGQGLAGGSIIRLLTLLGDSSVVQWEKFLYIKTLHKKIQFELHTLIWFID